MSEQAASPAVSPAGNPLFEVGSTEQAEQPIRCGVAGLGRIGWGHHAQIIQKHGGFVLAVVCDPEEDRRAEAVQATGCAAASRFEEMLENDAVELVIVATPSIEHEPMTIAALNAGKHVLCEKPAAQSAAGIRRMRAAAQEAGKTLTMHHNYRLNPEFLYVREVIESGVLGRVFRIKRRVQSFARRNDWQVLRKYGGGMTGNWGIHLVDACLCLLDSDVADVWGDVRQVFNPGDAEDDIKALIRGESGMTLDIDMTSANAAPEPSWVVMGDCGTLWIEGKTAHLKYFDPKELPPVQVNDHPYALDRKYGVMPGPDAIPWQQRDEEPKPQKAYPSFYDNLYRAIRQGEPLLVEPDSALKTYEALDRIREGSRFAPPE
ncbi:MAG: Gfo/Idh/MocA family oxidoreductase [Armatimonadetes bacterium]|nr:Gfo/Idh/MocA family oxidoreductase [Armatimonadota bacterium]